MALPAVLYTLVLRAASHHFLKIIIITTEIAKIDSSQITVEAFYDGFRISWVQQNFVDNLAISYHLQMAKGDEDFVNIYRGSTSKFTLKMELEGDTVYRWVVECWVIDGEEGFVMSVAIVAFVSMLVGYAGSEFK